MLTNIFSARNKKFALMLKMGDCLSRSLRENVDLFSCEDDQVSYLTESGYLIRGTFAEGKDVVLENIEVKNADEFFDEASFSKFVDTQVRNFIGHIKETKIEDSNSSFSNILNLWETRLHFTRTKERLTAKKAKLGDSTSIIELSRV